MKIGHQQFGSGPLLGSGSSDSCEERKPWSKDFKPAKIPFSCKNDSCANIFTGTIFLALHHCPVLSVWAVSESSLSSRCSSILKVADRQARRRISWVPFFPRL